MKKLSFGLIAIFIAIFGLQSCFRDVDADNEPKTVADLAKLYNLKVLSSVSKEEAKSFGIINSVKEANIVFNHLKNIKTHTEGKLNLKSLRGSAENSGVFKAVLTDFAKSESNEYRARLGSLDAEDGQVPPGYKNMIDDSWAHPYNILATLSWQANFDSPSTSVMLTGVTLGYSFSQGGQSTSYNSSTGIFTYSVTGTLNYNVFVEGVGTIYSTPYSVYGSYNTTTGSYSIYATSSL